MTSSVQDAGLPVEPVRPVTAVVVAGTHVRLTRLQQMLASVGIEVLAAVRTVDEGVAAVDAHEPDTVLLDLAMGAGGLELVERVMARRATPIVLTGAAAERADVALAAGAVDLVTPGTEGLGPVAYSRALARHLGVASRVRVITHPRGRLRERGLAVGSAPAGGSSHRRPGGALPSRRPSLVVIGASTGGPPALARILGALPADLDVPIVVVQHMAEGFVEGLARWLDGVVGLPVSVALNGDRLRPGHVVLAPSDGNLVVEQGLRIRIEDPRPDQFHVPEIDRTLATVAEVCRERAVGVLLTGMGRDGAVGMLALRRAGGFTIGQDEGTSAVWGMPAAAAALDGLDVELPLPGIAAGIVEAVGRLRIHEAV
ncbi:MAG: response regulator [Actinomycetales bacterium]|nr:response regulator [Actinomycetales bacterium]